MTPSFQNQNKKTKQKDKDHEQEEQDRRDSRARFSGRADCGPASPKGRTGRTDRRRRQVGNGCFGCQDRRNPFHAWRGKYGCGNRPDSGLQSPGHDRQGDHEQARHPDHGRAEDGNREPAQDTNERFRGCRKGRGFAAERLCAQEGGWPDQDAQGQESGVIAC